MHFHVKSVMLPLQTEDVKCSNKTEKGRSQLRVSCGFYFLTTNVHIPYAFCIYVTMTVR